MKINYVTTNKGKVSSLQSILANKGITVVQTPIELVELRSLNVEEIAQSKATQAFNKIQKPVVVSDAGFYISSLNGFPHTYVNFVLTTIGLDGILKLVDGKDRYCEFVECLAYLDDKLTSPKYFVGKVGGTLSTNIHELRNSQTWSELSRIFIPSQADKTLSSMGHDEYISWRTEFKDKDSAYQKFANWLDSSSLL